MARDEPFITTSPGFAPMMSLFQQALASGRLSDNVEDHRGLTRWNRPALDAINTANGMATQVDHPSATFTELPPPQAPRSAPTPTSTGIDDLFTRTPTYHTAPTADWQAQEARWRDLDARTAATNRGTLTPGHAEAGDGSTNPPPVDGMSSQMVPQTMTPNPNPQPIDPTMWMQMDKRMETMPSNGADLPARASPAEPAASPDLAGLLRSLFAF